MNDLDIALEPAEVLRNMVAKLPAADREDMLFRIYRARVDIRLDMQHTAFTLWQGHTGFSGKLI